MSLVHFTNRNITELQNSTSHSGIVTKITDLDKEHKQLLSTTSQTLEALRKDILTLITKRSDDLARESSAVSQIANKLSALVETANNMNTQHILLRSLDFEAMNTREDLIKDTHPGTSKWIFDPGMSCLSTWLTSENGVFWIEGKVSEFITC